MALVGVMALGCTGGRLHLSAADHSASNSDGSKSDGSKSDSSKSDGTGSDGSKSDGSRSDSSNSDKSSDGSSDNSSDTHSETSGTVSTRGNEEKQSNAVGLYIITGAVLLGATTIGAVLLMANDEPARYATQHERGIRLALSRGEGPFVLDVADNLGLPRTALPVLAHTLRGARKTLEPYLLDTDGEGISTSNGERFAADLARTLESEPVLAPYVIKLRDEVARLLTSAASVAP